MKDHKMKTVLVLLATFSLGIVFGAMLNRTISQNRIKKFMSLRTRDGLILRLQRIIGPDAVQAKEVREILEKYAQRVAKINEEMKERRTTTMKDFSNDLSGVLTPQQMERVLNQLPFSPRFRRSRRFPDDRGPGRPMRRFQENNRPRGKEPYPKRDKKEVEKQDDFI